MRRRTTLKEALANYSRRSEAGCVIWTGPVSKIGYGVTQIWNGDKRSSTTAHRAAWIDKHGPIDPGLHVCHTCDNRLCINIDHLFLGTQLDNIRDMYQKGRENPRGAYRPKQTTTNTRCCADSDSTQSIYSATEEYSIEQQMETEQLTYKQCLEKRLKSRRSLIHSTS